KKVQLGDVAVYAPDCFRLGENRVASPAMDDRCACALLVKLLQTVGETKDTVIAVFSVQEEVGCRGAKVASFSQEPDVGIALDGTAWGDTPEVKLPAIKLGEGCAVKVMDRASISNPALRDELLACGEAAGVKTQREVLPFGGTDAGAMQTSRGGIPVCTISSPCRYVHSACETIDMRDMDAALKLLTAYLKK
ncbi:MAG: M20/M25/M40 family metallo-hydrolase, partial [Clostridia bacterium]|nr:M20/M25/M40 family metallo-hydrolase [Clostridia bacterium]